MTTAILPLNILVPFAVILGFTLVTFYVVSVREGYEAPISMADSAKRIGTVMLFGGGGWLLGSLIVNDPRSFAYSEFFIGLAVSGLLLLLIDFAVLHLRNKRGTR